MNVEPGTPLDAALAYRQSFGWSVIPINPADKVPLLSWDAYQQRPADDATIRDWWGRWPMAGVGIVTGLVSQLWVVDVDSEAGRRTMSALPVPSTTRAMTAKGEHLYFRRVGPLRNTTKRADGIDTRGDGGYVVAPPTVRPDGSRYRWFCSPWDVRPVPPPAEVVALFDTPAASQSPRDNDAGYSGPDYALMLTKGSPEGSRNSDAAKLAGRYIARGLPAKEVAALLLPWATRCHPPLDQDELFTVIRHIAQAEARKVEELRQQSTHSRRGAFTPERRVEDVIHDWGLSLTADGDWQFLRGPCPFHRDAARSLWVHAPSQTWGCRVCRIKGDIERFVEMTADLPRPLAQTAV